VWLRDFTQHSWWTTNRSEWLWTEELTAPLSPDYNLNDGHADRDRDWDANQVVGGSGLRDTGSGLAGSGEQIGSHSSKAQSNIQLPGSVSSRVQYRRQCRDNTSSDWRRHFAAYTNGASVKRIASYWRVGPQYGINSEENYAERVADAGFCAAILCPLLEGCPEDFGGPLSAGQDYVALFEHMSGDNHSPGWVDYSHIAMHY